VDQGRAGNLQCEHEKFQSHARTFVHTRTFLLLLLFLNRLKIVNILVDSFFCIDLARGRADALFPGDPGREHVC